MMNSSPPTASSAASGSVVASGGISNVAARRRRSGTSGAARWASRVHASSASRTVEAAHSERRNARRGIPSRTAFSSQCRRRAADRLARDRRERRAGRTRRSSTAPKVDRADGGRSCVSPRPPPPSEVPTTYRSATFGGARPASPSAVRASTPERRRLAPWTSRRSSRGTSRSTRSTPNAWHARRRHAQIQHSRAGDGDPAAGRGARDPSVRRPRGRGRDHRRQPGHRRAREGEVFGMWSLLGHVAPAATVRAAEDTHAATWSTPEVARPCSETAPASPSSPRASGGGSRASTETLRRRRSTPSVPRGGRARAATRRSPASRRRPSPRRRRSWRANASRACWSLTRGGRRDPHGPRPAHPGRRDAAGWRHPGRGRHDATGAETIPADTMAGEVLLRMLEGGFHHFPVVDGRGRIVGVVTDTDLMGIGRNTPFALKSADRARGRPRGRRRRHAANCRGDRGARGPSADPVDVGHIIAFSIDAATRRLLELGVERLGAPPVAWAWLALGSAARQEQAIRTDQDHAHGVRGRT